MSVGEFILILGIIVLLILPSLKDRIVSIRRLIILPAVFMYMLYRTIVTSFHLVQTSYVAIIVGLLLGVLLGLFIRKNLPIKADKEKALILIPGNTISLIIFIVIFIVEFVAHYLFVATPEIKQANMNQYLLLIVLCGVSSLTVGGNLIYFYKYWQAESVELELSK